MKCLPLYTLVFLLYSCDHIKDPICDGNCINGYGVMKWRDGGYEKGNWQNGWLYGHGVEYFGYTSHFSGDSYVGNFDHGYDGEGSYTDVKDDVIHIGQWKHGVPNGYGKSIFGVDNPHPHQSFEGEWKDGKKNGYGIFYFGDQGENAKERYTGYWKNDLMDGTGIYYFVNGARYIGHFSNDVEDGNGTVIFSDGSKYKGHWVNGRSNDFDKLLADRKRHGLK
jgi:hypothetical protein